MNRLSGWLIPPALGLGLLAGSLGPLRADNGEQGPGEDQRVFRFSQADLGKVPEGWTVDRTGKGEGSEWKVVADDTSASGTGYILAQTAQSPRRMFNLCVVEDSNYRDVEIEVAFKAVKGKVDQGGGVVWRYQDADNYYITRMNPLEDNYRFYKVVDGKRTQLATKEGLKVPAGEWHVLEIEHKGNQIECELDGEELFNVQDDTFEKAGKVGLWTKADAVTFFDEVWVRALGGGTERSRSKRAPATGGVLVWESRFTRTPPKVDGIADEVWRTAKPLAVVVREAIGGHHPTSVVLRALHTDDFLFVLAEWPDVTKSDMRDPYVWNPNQGRYERPSKPDDQFALEFPIRGQFDVNMLALSRDYIADVWHWKAGRGNPAGWVDDKRHIVSPQPTADAREYSMGGHGKVYIARVMDEGTPSYVLKSPPTVFEGDIVDSYRPQQPEGSLADVRGKGVHDGKGWTLEMSRKFDTGHDDDAVIDPRRSTSCAIAVLDDELYWHHSVSPLIMLRFLQE